MSASGSSQTPQRNSGADEPSIGYGRRQLVLGDSTFAPGQAGTVRWRAGERLDRLFEEQCDWLGASGRGELLAVDTGDLALTYGELDAWANQLARYLSERGARPGDRIALLFDHGVHSYVGMLAALKVQAAYVPLDARFPTDRIGYIAEDADVRMVLSLSHLADRLPDLTARDIELVLLDKAAERVANLDPSRLLDAERGGPVGDLAYLIYTSGSTGRPKGVAIDHPSICNFVRVAAEVYELTEHDRMYQGLTVAFDFSVEEIWVPWMVGATLVPKPPGASLLGAELHEFLTSHRATAMCCVPTLLATIEDDLPNLRFLLVSGEACPRDLIARWHKPGRRFLNVYGPTEATVTATWTELNPDKPVTIGVPLPTYSVVVLDPENPYRALPHGETGEIGIGGIGLARGYLNRDDLTEKAFITDFLGLPNNPSGRIYRTGDLGRVNADGEIEYKGRIDSQVKIRGYRIELTEIESVLLRVPGIAQAVVDTYQPEPGVIELVAYYSPRRDAAAPDRELVMAQLRDRLPPYMVPAYLEELAVIPMTASDKADRKRLPAPSGPRGVASRTVYVAPTSPTERVLADSLAGVLRLDRVSVDGDFFTELGADSLLMARFCGRLRKVPGLSPPAIVDVYRHPTVRRLAAHIGEADDAGATGHAARVPGAPGTSDALFEEERVAAVGTTRYLLCGALQVLISLGFAFLAAWILVGGLRWISAAATVTSIYERSLVFSIGGFLFACTFPIAAKWVLVGRWKRQQIPLWSVAYLRFWLVKSLIRVDPLVLFAGSPLYLLYLRALGAKIGRGAAIFSRRVPVCTDLLSVGEHAVIRKDSSFTCYRAHAGAIQTGAVTLGSGALVSDAAVLDIETSMGDGAQLGHASCLGVGQWVPAWQRWHGSPAQPTDTDYRTVPETRCGAVRKIVYSVAQLVPPLIVGLSLVLTVLVLAFTRIPVLVEVLGPGHQALTRWESYAVVAGIATTAMLAGLLLGLLAVMIVPRVLKLAVKPDRVYPLYGVRYWISGIIAALTNTGFNHLTGDSSYVVHYLRALGYDLSNVVQTGSNFGLIMKHDTPYLSSVGSETMVSDGLTIANADYSSTSFRLSRVAIGAHNFLGNHITYPTSSAAGDNCLLATKVMVPIDGPVRENVGLLGSPPFEIPRSVQRDGRFDDLKTGDELRTRLIGKLRHNTVTIALFLFLGWFLTVGTALLVLATVDLFALVGVPVIPAGLLAALVFTVGTLTVVDRATTGFRALIPVFHSIYDRRFWRHERFWKLTTTSVFEAFNGTPLKGLIWRLLGVRIGRRVFDDGCSIPERSLVTIGDRCTLNAGSALWSHSLEDGTFKSDRIEIGADVNLGVGAFVHYGVTMGDGSTLDADSYLMKGEEVTAQDRWQGNPARPIPFAATVARRQPDQTPDQAELFRRIAILESRLDRLTGNLQRSPGAEPVERGPVLVAAASTRSRWRPAVSSLLAVAVVLLAAAGVAVGIWATSLPATVPVAFHSLLHSVVPAVDGSVEPAAPGGTPASGQPGPGAPAAPPSAVTAPGDAARVAYVRDFYALLPGNVPAAFELLAPEFQRQSGGLAGFSRRFRDVTSLAILGEPIAVDVDTVTVRVRFQRRGGQVSDEQYRFTLSAGPDSRMTIQAFQRL